MDCDYGLQASAFVKKLIIPGPDILEPIEYIIDTEKTFSENFVPTKTCWYIKDEYTPNSGISLITDKGYWDGLIKIKVWNRDATNVYGADRYAGCEHITFRHMRDTFNNMCYTTEEIGAGMEWFDLTSEALNGANIDRERIGVAQSYADVNPRLGIYATGNAKAHSLLVTGKYEYDLGLTGLVTSAIGLFPNISPFMTKSDPDHPDENIVYHPADLLVATATMR